jgi:hypothetical protein
MGVQVNKAWGDQAVSCIDHSAGAVQIGRCEFADLCDSISINGDICTASYSSRTVDHSSTRNDHIMCHVSIPLSV